MKKILSIFGAVAVLVASTAFISCGDNGDEFSGATDTVITLATPSVTAKAYPGYNLVSWQPVPNAKKYEVYRYETGNLTDTYVGTVAAGTALYKEDNSDLQNKVSYTYKVVAVGGALGTTSSANRAVIAKDSNAGSATVTAIVPPMDTKPLDLAAYESGYDGSKVKTLSDGEKKNYLLDADSTDLTSSLAQLAVAIRAKAYLSYDVYLDAGDKYSVTNTLLAADKKIISDGKNSTIENNTVLPMKAAVTAAGEYAVYVEVSAKSPYYVNKDVVKVGTVKYDLVEASTNPTIATEYPKYIDAGATARVTFTGVTFADGTNSTASNFVVYRTDETANGYAAVSGTVTETNEGSNSYYVDDTITDNTKKYQYVVVLTKDGKYGNAAAAGSLGAYSKTAVSVTNDPSGSPSALDTDGIANDITWTVELDDKKDTFKAYILSKDASYTGTPVAADFDTTTALTAVAEDDTTGTTWKIYSKNAAIGKHYLLVVYSEEGKKDTYKVSTAVSVTAATVSDAKLDIVAKVYDNATTFASTGSATNNDVLINVTDTITVVSDSISNYTYTLYKTTSTIKADYTGTSFEWKAVDNWTKVRDLTLVSNTAYDSAAADVEYVAVVALDDQADGAYAYKVVKSNANESVAKVTYARVCAVYDAGAIQYTPSISAAWAASTATATRDVKVTFTKDIVNEAPITDDGHTIGYKEETVEAGVTYTLYRADVVRGSADLYSLVFTKLNATVSSSSNAETSGVFYYKETKGSDGTWTTATEATKVATKINYTFTDSGVSTGKSYYYVVVASKEGADDVVSNIYETVEGAN